MNTTRKGVLATFTLLAFLLLTGCGNVPIQQAFLAQETTSEVHEPTMPTTDIQGVQQVQDVQQVQGIQEPAYREDPSVGPDNIPEYSGQANVLVNGDRPYFTEDDLTIEPFEEYCDLDALGRCGVAYANICMELMPTEPRGDIGMIKPTGWVQNKYPELIDDNYLYNRCHLIGFQLAGENANDKNLITGTRYLNIEGMLGLENTVADYIHMNPDNHVLYRVTPVFEGNDLLCRGVLMEAMSVEDKGHEVCFCRFAYNVQPGIGIDYATGDNWVDENAAKEDSVQENAELKQASSDSEASDYVLNTRSMKFHRPDCTGLPSDKNRKDVHAGRNELIAQGYSPCGICNP